MSEPQDPDRHRAASASAGDGPRLRQLGDHRRPIWLSFSYPSLVAYFVLSFDFYWLCRALWFARRGDRRLPQDPARAGAGLVGRGSAHWITPAAGARRVLRQLSGLAGPAPSTLGIAAGLAPRRGGDRKALETELGSWTR